MSSSKLSPLMRAAAIGHEDAVRILLAEGAEVNELGPRGSTALMFAAGGGHLEIVKLLVEHQAEIDAVELGGWNALRHAEEDQHPEIVVLLQQAKLQPTPSNDAAESKVNTERMIANQ